MTMNNKQLTPLEQLIVERRQLRHECRVQGQKINNSFNDIYQNAGSLLVSGFVALFLNKRKDCQEEAADSTGDGEATGNNPFTGCMDMAKVMMPFVWDFVKPIAYGWLAKQAGVLIKKAFCSGK